MLSCLLMLLLLFSSVCVGSLCLRGEPSIIRSICRWCAFQTVFEFYDQCPRKCRSIIILGNFEDGNPVPLVQHRCLERHLLPNLKCWRWHPTKCSKSHPSTRDFLHVAIACMSRVFRYPEGLWGGAGSALLVIHAVRHRTLVNGFVV